MSILTLSQIPGFADISNANFAENAYAIGLNFQRLIDNVKFGTVRPEIFMARYGNGATVDLPTSIVDGYTYQRAELVYSYHFDLTGGTDISQFGAPSAPGSIRYLNAYIDQLTGIVTTNVEYLVANGTGAAITNDGTLCVFTIATRQMNALTVASIPAYASILDTEFAVDKAVTESIMQRLNTNAKAAVVKSEIIYLGEYVDGDSIPRPVSPADGYQYGMAEVIFHANWRWTTQGNALVDPTNGNYKQIQDLSWGITTDNTANTAVLETMVTWYNSGYYPTTYGRMAVFAFCSRALPSGGLGAGGIDFVDLTPDFWASGRFDRFDVTARQAQNTRYAMLRPEYFVANYTNGQLVTLPVSTIDGYQYSRDELSYVYEYASTGNSLIGISASEIRIASWLCTVNQGTGLVTSNVTRLADGSRYAGTNDGIVRVITIARRDHVSNADIAYTYANSGSTVDDFADLFNPSFEQWNATTDESATDWSIDEQTGSGYGAQSPGLMSTFSQRLGVTAGATPAQTMLGSYPASHSIAILSNPVTTASGSPYYLGWLMQPSAGLGGGLTLTVRIYNAIGDSRYFVLKYDSEAVPAGITQPNYFFTMPTNGDANVICSNNGGTVPLIETGAGAVALDFTPTSFRLEFYYDGPIGAYVDLDNITLIDQLDPSIGQIASKGSGSLAFLPQISFTVTDTEFTPTLTFSIQRSDGTIINIAQGSGTTVTGLTQSTTYYWYPYYSEVQKIVLSLSAGGVGTPSWLQAAATQALYAQWFAAANLPLAVTPIAITTLATPTGGGAAPPSGGSGGGRNGDGGDPVTELPGG